MQWNIEEIFSMEWNMEWKIFSLEWKCNGRKLLVWSMEKSSSIPFIPCTDSQFWNASLCPWKRHFTLMSHRGHKRSQGG